MLKTPVASMEGVESLRHPGEIVMPETFDAVAIALSKIKGYPLDIMVDHKSAVSQQEILAAWIMGVSSIGTSYKDINPDILLANAHLGGEQREAADMLLSTLDTLSDFAITETLKAGVNGVIAEAEKQLKKKGYPTDSPEIQDLYKLNAAKSMFNSTYPQDKK